MQISSIKRLTGNALTVIRKVIIIIQRYERERMQIERNQQRAGGSDYYPTPSGTEAVCGG